MALRYLVPALAIANRAAAAVCSGTTTIANAADASGLATCQTFSGSIAIATGTSDDIALDGIRRITGSLIAKDVPHMASLSADSLSQIDDTFGLENIQTLTTLSFPMLTAVDTVEWIGLPNLQQLSFTNSLQKASALSIQNTGLTSLDGINLQVISTLILANNNYLDTISMQLGSVAQALALEANGRNLQVEFPNMQWAYNMTFRNCSSVSIPSLSSVNGSLGFYNNYFDTLSAVNLTQIGQSLSFVSNGALTNISLPELTTVVGGFQIANNTKLMEITLPRLKQIGGAIDFYGAFKSVTMPMLNLVRGAFNLQSTQDIENSCNHFHSIAGPNSDIRGKFTCVGKTSNPGGLGTASSGTNSGGGTSKSGASALLISSAAGVIGVVAAIFTML